jgi:hypothetical protein
MYTYYDRREYLESEVHSMWTIFWNLSWKVNVPVTFCFESDFRFLHFQCSKSCGEGAYQHRQVRCQSHTGKMLADMFCSALEKPNEQHKCDLPQCHISYSDSNLKPVAKEYQWRTGMWSQVSFLLYSLRTYWCSCLHNKYSETSIYRSRIHLSISMVPERILFRRVSHSGIWRRVVRWVVPDVSEERITSIFRVVE